MVTNVLEIAEGEQGEWEAVQSKKNKKKARAFGKEGLHQVDIMAVEEKMTRRSAMKFHIAKVQKPLASAAKVTEAGNTIVLKENGGYVENNETKERMAVRKEKGVFVMDVIYTDGSNGVITLDSGAGVCVWPVGLENPAPMGPKAKGLKMVAANGTEITNFGTKDIKFWGMDAGSVFPRRA